MRPYSVLYSTSRGLASYYKGKALFPNRSLREKGLREGLVELDLKSLYDKTTHGFISMRNVDGVFPNEYTSVEFHVGFGVPDQVWRGTFGTSIIIKERRRTGYVLKAYGVDGTLFIHEKEFSEGSKYNPNYYRLNTAVLDWKDITDQVLPKIFNSIYKLNFDIDLTAPIVLDLCKHLRRNWLYESNKGVKFLTGKYETLLFWSNGGTVHFCWLGRKMDWVGERKRVEGVMK